MRRGAAAAAVVEGEGGDSSSGPWLEPGGREDGRREGAPSNKKKRPMRGGGGGETNARALQSHFPQHFHAVEACPLFAHAAAAAAMFSPLPPSLPRFPNGEWRNLRPLAGTERPLSVGEGEDGRARNATRERRRGGKCLCRRGGGGGPDGEDGERLSGGCAVHAGRGGGVWKFIHLRSLSTHTHEGEGGGRRAHCGVGGVGGGLLRRRRLRRRATQHSWTTAARRTTPPPCLFL